MRQYGSSAAFARRLREAPLPRAVSGDGVYVIDSAGRRYLDGSSGTGISSLGHSHAAVREAMRRQLGELAFAHTSFFSNEPMDQLAGHLTSALPGASVWFTASGAEAVDASLKLARQYFVERGEPERQWVVGRRRGYLGAAIGALAAGGNTKRQASFAPLLFANVEHIDPCFPYREMHAGEGDAAYAQRTADQLEAAIRRIGPSRVMAFVAETIVGSTLGAVAAPAPYFSRIREICDRHGVLLLLDEVMCGMGRSGTRYAFEQEGIEPDMVMLGKGLAAGYAPLGAAVVQRRVVDVLRNGSGAFWHGHSAHGHALACAAGLAVQREIDRAALLTHVRDKGALLRRMLGQSFENHPFVGDIRGRGLFLAIELVRDRSSKDPFDAALRMNERVKQMAFETGLICYPGSGTADGIRGDHVMVMPPFITSDAQLDELVSKLGIAIDRATGITT